MNTRSLTRPFGSLALAVSLAASSHSFGALIHDYDFDGTLDDALAGPSLVASGGVLLDGYFLFGPEEGLILSSALPDPESYSILIDFSFTDLTGYRRIVDFKDNLSDTGLYNLETALNFFNITTGPTVFVPNEPFRLVLTRDGMTDLFEGYVNGDLQISFTDDTDLTVFDATDNVIKFFLDDIVVPGESSGGSVGRISIYDAPLNASEVFDLGGSDPIPEPGTALLGLTGLAICLSRRIRQDRTAR